MSEIYELLSFSADRLGEVAGEWKAIAGEDEFKVELAAAFEWCESHLQHKEGDAHALELFNVTRGVTDGILEVVNADRGALTKLLKLWVSPTFWAIDPADRDLLERAIELYAAAHVEVIAKAVGGGCEEVKIYGRTDTMLGVLKRIQAIWPSDKTGWSASMQGRWLSIRKGLVSV